MFNIFLENNLIYIVAISSVLIILLFLYIIYLHKKIYNLTKGSNGSSLEDIINQTLENTLDIKDKNEKIIEHAISLDVKTSNSIRNIQTLRYKAFETGGSNQSFSTALLNEKGDGVIITSLYLNDKVNTFAKPIEKYKSIYDLTEEEKEVIEKSKREHKENR